ncbi:hypothetical protein MPS_5306 [Mycobacterium pseudoshottsii JCM 15466]|nr:hypothetical protein MMSP_2611 [Mycobacterium sp. 012931]MBC9860837.1 hypothetical protein [Mycobacterium pseudoshottsii]GAQ40673.1 hypothetical protein MPS_5306 [Mycobacterium pseudoshottsii JCM 15466]
MRRSYAFDESDAAADPTFWCPRRNKPIERVARRTLIRTDADPLCGDGSHMRLS